MNRSPNTISRNPQESSPPPAADATIKPHTTASQQKGQAGNSRRKGAITTRRPRVTRPAKSGRPTPTINTRPGLLHTTAAPPKRQPPHRGGQRGLGSRKKPRAPGPRLPWTQEPASRGGWGSLLEHEEQVTTLEALRQQLPGLVAPPEPPLQRPRPRRARQLDHTQIDELIASYRAGTSTYQLAERFDIERRTVSAIPQRHDIPMRSHGLNPEHVDEAIRLYTQGWSLARIGNRMDVTADTVRARLLKHGVTMRDTHGRHRKAGES